MPVEQRRVREHLEGRLDGQREEHVDEVVQVRDRLRGALLGERDEPINREAQAEGGRKVRVELEAFGRFDDV